MSVLEKKLPIRVLIADDNPTNQYCAHELLSRIGYDADIADNGEEALSMTQAQNYDIIFMDVRMPLMDGLEATRRIRAMGKKIKQPYVIALTANVLPADQEVCFISGMDDFVAKPIRFENLRTCFEAFKAKHSLN